MLNQHNPRRIGVKQTEDQDIELIEELETIPNYLRDQRIIELLDKRHIGVTNLPIDYLTEVVLLHAVKLYRDIITFIPGECVTENVYLYSIQNNNYFAEIPKHLQNMDFYFKCVKINHMTLAYIPLDSRTKELCFEAVRTNSYAISYFPNELFLIEQFCIELIEYDYNIFEYIKGKYKTEKICLLAVEKNGKMIQNVPHNLKTYEVCKMAIESIKLKYNHIDKELHPYFPKKFKYLITRAVKNETNSSLIKMRE
jgi:hypothetical protein